MPKYRDESIRKMVGLINDDYFLPDIQRPYVWTDEDVCFLFDSIMKDYPISTFLLWEVDKHILAQIKRNYGFELKKFDFIRTNSDENKENTKKKDKFYLVLDGQQRLTSFNIALNGEWTKNDKDYELYFNVLSGEDFEEDKDVSFEFAFKDRTIEGRQDYYVEPIISNNKKIKRNIFDSFLETVSDKDDAQLIAKSYKLTKNTYNLLLDETTTEFNNLKLAIEKHNYKLWVRVKNILSISGTSISKRITTVKDQVVSGTRFEENCPNIIFDNIHSLYDHFNSQEMIS